ncbi:hypothetical protein ID866_12240 [Astraeus odoratus]|nr:hypothetical protein ID866_12240 [Astraeus odoratus]
MQCHYMLMEGLVGQQQMLIRKWDEIEGMPGEGLEDALGDEPEDGIGVEDGAGEEGQKKDKGKQKAMYVLPDPESLSIS